MVVGVVRSACKVDLSWHLGVTIFDVRNVVQCGRSYRANACGGTMLFCHASRTGATKRVRSVKKIDAGIIKILKIKHIKRSNCTCPPIRIDSLHDPIFISLLELEIKKIPLNWHLNCHFGPLAFRARIRATSYPRRFRPSMHISMYDGKTNPDHWLEDYLLAMRAEGVRWWFCRVVPSSASVEFDESWAGAAQGQ
jgi:hypothetical protein